MSSSTIHHPVVETRVVFGTLVNDRFLGKAVWDMMREFTSLPPAEFWVEEQTIEFEVGAADILRPQNEAHRYFVRSNFRQQCVTAQTDAPLQRPIVYRLTGSSVKPIELDRITLSRVRVDLEPFIVMPQAGFIDAAVISRSRRVVNEYYGRTWTWNFQEVFTFPKWDQSVDSRLYFDSPPRYRVQVTTPGFATDAETTSFLAASLPKSLNNYRPHVYYQSA